MSNLSSIQPLACPRCGFAVAPGKNFCTKCGGDMRGGGQARPYDVAPPPAAPRIGRFHSPLIALLVALIIPGAGQAYNGQPIKGFFLLFLSALIIPWLYSLYDAYAGARRIVQFGGRMAKGGLFWVGMQAWLLVNVAALVAIILTISGVLL